MESFDIIAEYIWRVVSKMYVGSLYYSMDT